MSNYIQNATSINTDYHYIKGSYSDNFEEATKLLTEIVKIESEHMHIIKPIKKKSNVVSVIPSNLDDTILENYTQIKIRYKQLLESLLATRSAFTKKMKIDITSTIHTLQNVQPCIEDLNEVRQIY
jgi:predicted nuclease with TOPRIM domain